MDLTLAEAATLLGKSERQIRYLIRQDRLSARKQGNRWLVESESLPLTEAQRDHLGQRVDRARAAFDKAVAPADKVGSKVRKTYSVTDLDAFRIGVDLLRAVRAGTGGASPAADMLYACLEDLARGCHEFQAKLKGSRFSESRDAAARAAVRLFTEAEANESMELLGQRIEAELIPKLAGLVASQEKRSRRSRFERMGPAFRAGDRE